MGPHAGADGWLNIDAVDAALVSAFVVLAAADWAMIWRGSAARRPLTKTAATIALVAVAGRAGDMAADARTVLLAAVLLCLAGDVALLDAGDRRFLAGLGAFAAGHAAYVVTAVVIGVSWPRLAVAAPVLALLAGFQLATRMLPGARLQGGKPMMLAVAVYSAIISVMVVTATGTPSWLAAAGAVSFAVSDSTIAYDRFVRSIRRADLPVMVTYHAGQLLLVLGLIAGG